jgi:hypothetical protein
MIELVTSSHNHTDHLDAETLNPLRAANPGLRIIVPEANRAFAAARIGCDPAALTGLTDGSVSSIGPFTLEALPAAHEALDTDDQGPEHLSRLRFTAGPYRVYHSGDTVLYEGLAERLSAFDVSARAAAHQRRQTRTPRRGQPQRQRSRRPRPPGATSTSSSPATTTCSPSTPPTRRRIHPHLQGHPPAPSGAPQRRRSHALMHLGIDIGGNRLKAGLVTAEGQVQNLQLLHHPRLPPRIPRRPPQPRRTSHRRPAHRNRRLRLQGHHRPRNPPASNACPAHGTSSKAPSSAK